MRIRSGLLLLLCLLLPAGASSMPVCNCDCYDTPLCMGAPPEVCTWQSAVCSPTGFPDFFNLYNCACEPLR